MIVEASIGGIAVVVLSVFYLRPSDIVSPSPSPADIHLRERKRAIHESLRDLQFDFRLGKLSEPDYQETKLSLQRELAAVLLQIRETEQKRKNRCISCGTQFSVAMKFCGTCGKAML